MCIYFNSPDVRRCLALGVSGKDVGKWVDSGDISRVKTACDELVSDMPKVT